jgi:hypothetical protein
MSLNFKHTIGKNKANERPSHVLFADVESKLSDIGNGRTLFTPFLWTMIYHHYRWSDRKDTEIEYTGYVIGEFWDIVEYHTYDKTKTYLTTHHLEVDFMPLKGFVELNNRGWILDKLIAHNRVLIMTWKKDKRTLVIMNNGNIFPSSIADWGDTLAIPKLKMPKESDSLDDWYVYCMRDTRIMVEMWNTLFRFMDEHDLGNFKYTLASLALSAYKHRFQVKEIAIHDDVQVILLERLAYHGGRFQALKIGKWTNSQFYLLDINSMYAYIQSSCELPYELRGYKEVCDLRELEYRLNKYCVIAECDVDIPESFLPVKVEDKQYYPTGLHTVFLSSPEIRYCLDHNYIKAVRRIAWYYKDYVLKQYADYFTELKIKYTVDGNKPMRAITKLYPNALYGKFAQHGYKDKIIGDCNPDEFKFIEAMDYTTKERYTIAYYGGKIHETEVTLGGYNTFVALSAHITAYGRIMLFNLIKKAGWNNVYHVATDSLVVNNEGYTNLMDEINETVIGKLKLEKKFSDYTLKDVNDVIIDGVDKIKGIGNKAERIAEDTYAITAWPRITTLIKQGNLDHYYTRRVVKVLKRIRYHKEMGTPVSPIQTNYMADAKR